MEAEDLYLKPTTVKTSDFSSDIAAVVTII
jgi:hypothetical protein